MNDLESIDTGTAFVPYATIREAMRGDPYTMSLTEVDEIDAVNRAVDQGIDSRLQACYCPSRGDRYARGERRVGSRVLCDTLECLVSVESLPVLLRRLGEIGTRQEAAWGLQRDILATLGVDPDSGKRVGREALGLEEEC